MRGAEFVVFFEGTKGLFSWSHSVPPGKSLKLALFLARVDAPGSRRETRDEKYERRRMERASRVEGKIRAVQRAQQDRAARLSQPQLVRKLLCSL